MIYGMAKFIGANAKIKAKLTTGEEVEVYTTLQADGEYKQWTEDIHPDGIGYYETFCEQEIDEDTIGLLYPDEWEFIDENKQELYDDFDGVNIEEIIRVIDVEWEVDIDTLDDGQWNKQKI